MDIPFINRISSRSIALFTRQLSAMLGAGLPLSKALGILVKQTEEQRLKQALEAVANLVKSGTTLAEALRKQGCFSDLYCGMVAVGESGAALDEILKKLALYLEKQEKIKRKIITALTYPAVILGISGVVLVALFVYVIPTFSTMFLDVGKELPQSTQFIISLSGFVSANIIYLYPFGQPILV
jgi:type IV pilus assembly protein PilC